VAEVDGVVVEVEFHCETQSVIVATAASLDVVLVVANVFASPAPAPHFGVVFDLLFV